MRFKIDENLPQEVAELLRGAGHDVATVLDQDLGGAQDPSVAMVSRQEQRGILSFDVGFADIRRYPPEAYYGLVILRLQQQDKVSVLNVVRRLLPVLETEPLQGRLWIVEEQRVRIRG